MSTGYSPKLPLQRSATDGYYMMNKTFAEVVSQNIKMVVLTVPGEKIMDPQFGVGARNFLFGNTEQDSFMRMQNRIHEQIKKYLPFVYLREVGLIEPHLEPGEQRNLHSMGVKINYSIPDIGVEESLTIQFKANG